MSVGLTVSKSVLDTTAGDIVFQLRELLERVQIMKAWLDGQSDAALQLLGYSIGAGSDVELLRNSFTDLDNLRKIAHAQGTQAQANDFFFNAGKLTGLQ